MCWNRPLKYSCGCLAPFLVKEECELASLHEANYIRIPEEAGYPCDAHNRRRENSQGFRTTHATNNHNLSISHSSGRRTSSNRPPPIRNAFDEYLDNRRNRNQYQLYGQRASSCQPQQESSSSRFRSASHNRSPANQNSLRSPTPNSINRTPSRRIPRNESRETSSRPVNDNRSRSPESRRPIPQTPSTTRSNTARQAYETMMTSIDGRCPADTRNDRGDHYRSRSPPASTHQQRPRHSPRSTPRPLAQELSPFDPRSTVFRDAYNTMMTDITDEEIRHNMPDVDDEMFLSDMEEMVRNYLPDNYNTRRPCGSYR